MWGAHVVPSLLGPSVELLWGHETYEGCAEMCVRKTHVDSATGIFSGSAYGATKLVRGGAEISVDHERTQHHRMVGKNQHASNH
eukprot:9477689-Pyramimonas_sp.AAC.2